MRTLKTVLTLLTLAFSLAESFRPAPALSEECSVHGVSHKRAADDSNFLKEGSARNWQLVFRHSAKQVELVDVRPIRRVRRGTKKALIPGLTGAPKKFPYEIAWSDKRGRVVTKENIQIPVGLRGIPGEGGCTGLEPVEGVFVLRVRGPRHSLWNSRRLRNHKVTLRKSGTAILSGAAPAFLPTEETFEMPRTRAGLVNAMNGPVSATKVRDTGPDSNRHVMVLLSEGYTAEDLAAGKFTSDLESILQSFPTKAPWDALFNLTNVYRIDVASLQSGADVPPEGIFRETYFNTSYYTANIERLLAPDGTGLTRAVQAADNLVGAGAWDSIGIIVNSSKYGGSGGAVATTALDTGGLVLIHEFGHSIFGLADEYGGSSGTAPREAPEPNVDTSLPPKWSIWIEPGTQLPTANISANANVIGAFEGARYFNEGVYRPMSNCTMNELGAEKFCAICAETELLKYFETLAPLDGLSPPANTSHNLATGPKTFELALAPFPDLSISWKYCGQPLDRQVGSRLVLSGSDGTNSLCTLEANVRYSGKGIRSQAVTASYNWMVSGCAAVDSCGVCGGDGVSCPEVPTPGPNLLSFVRKKSRNGKCEFESRVTDSSGNPLVSQTVSLEKKAGAVFVPLKAGSTAANGIFRFKSIKPGSYRVSSSSLTSAVIKCPKARKKKR